MKLALKPSRKIPNAWVMEVDLREIPKCINIPMPDYWTPFTEAMDRWFIYPFDCRRIGGWLRYPDKTKTYWVYVTLPPERSKQEEGN